MNKKKIVILGAGLAGLSTAWHLQKKGVTAPVFEREAEAGGLCRSKNVGGFTFDYDGHLLHFRHHYTFRLVKNLLGNNLSEHTRNAWVFSHNAFIPYPFQANLYGLPKKVIKECLAGFLRAQRDGKAAREKDQTFLDWIHATFGSGIARHFMVPYNTKFWNLPLRELTCAWLDGFVPVPTARQIVEGAMKQNRWHFGYNAKFWYPAQGGIQSLARALEAQVKKVHTGCTVREINLARKELTFARGGKERYDILVSTIPLPDLPYIIKDLPLSVRPLFKALRWNSIFNLNLGIRKKPASQRHWIYFPEKDFCFFRTGYFSSFSSSLMPPATTSLYAEVSYLKKRPVDKNALTTRIKKDLLRAGLLGSQDVICAEDVNDIPYAYPLYDQNHRSSTEKIIGFLKGNDIIACGRFGSWRYMSMEDVLLEGREVALRM